MLQTHPLGKTEAAGFPFRLPSPTFAAMSKDTTPDAALAQIPFEEAMRQLETIVSQLERGEVSLEESIGLYERGEALKKRCETLLREAEMRIEKIQFGPDGKPSGTTPLDA